MVGDNVKILPYNFTVFLYFNEQDSLTMTLYGNGNSINSCNVYVAISNVVSTAPNY